jgi:hypothetical protein
MGTCRVQFVGRWSVKQGTVTFWIHHAPFQLLVGDFTRCIGFVPFKAFFQTLALGLPKFVEKRD